MALLLCAFFDDDGLHVRAAGPEMMMGTAAQEYVIPSGVTQIGSRAFAQLQQAAIIRIPATVSSIAENAFEGSHVLFKCPENSYAARFARDHGIPLAE